MNSLIPWVESNDVGVFEEELRAHRRGARDLDEAVLRAAELGRAEHLSVLLRNGADLSCRHPASRWTLLHVAVEHWAFDVARVLVEFGMDVNVQDPQGMTPLHLAVDAAADAASQTGAAPDIRMLKLLLELGASPRVPNELAATPTDWAVDSGHPEIVAVVAGAGCATTTT